MDEKRREVILAEQRERGIHCLPVPTPFAVGRVNCYLIETEPLTLIDAGPRSERSLAELTDLVKATGHRLEDIELIVVTHQHVDHVGLVGTVAELAGAEVAALDLVVDRLADFGRYNAAEDDMAVDLMIANGVDAEIANGLRAVSEAFRDLGGPVEVTTPLTDGGSLELADVTFDIHHRPGHSPSDTIFRDPETGLTIGGDHLLSHISSNPLISRPLDGGPGRTRSLLDYEESLKKTREMDISLMLSGHGDPIEDHRALIDSRLEAQDRRSRKILDIITERPRTAHQIAEAIWGDVAMTQAYLTLSEVIGHTDGLERDGKVTAETVDGLVLFSATGTSGES
jgi:glyoxylase-like metal-dependent hydrolase (beta-lactamase superfamily II)